MAGEQEYKSWSQAQEADLELGRDTGEVMMVLLISKVVVMQAPRPEFKPQPLYKESGMVAIIPVLGSERFVNPWGSLARQPRLISKLGVPMKDPISINNRQINKQINK